MLMRWSDNGLKDATWGDYTVFCQTYPSFHLEDKVVLQGGEDDTSQPIPVTHVVEDLGLGMTPKENTVKDMGLGPTIGPKIVKRPLAWLIDYVT